MTPFAIWLAGRPFGRPFYFPPCLFNKLPGYSRARANLTASAQRTALGRAPRLRLGVVSFGAKCVCLFEPQAASPDRRAQRGPAQREEVFR
ncbi:MAG: hypothetical protein FalmKO_14720 [Falsiruegeria mediterranea]